MIEFRSGRKVVKSVSSVDEANTLSRKLITIRNDDSMWEVSESETMSAWSAMEEVLGTSVDVYAAMTIWLDGKKARTLWTKGF